MSESLDENLFASLYGEKARWDIGRPQQVLIDIADQVTGSILDTGCGTGENALFFAARGHQVLGIDFIPFPIEEARRKAAERRLTAEFLCRDALTLATLGRTFDNVIDSGLFHVFSDEDRRRYVDGLAHVTHSGGHVFLLCFSNEEPGTDGPRRISEQDLQTAFSSGWQIEQIRPARFEVIPDPKGRNFTPGGPKAWFAVIRRR